MASSEPFQIISSLRYDPQLPELLARSPSKDYPDSLKTPYYLLPYHRDRLRNAASHFQWEKALKFLNQNLSDFVRVLDTFIPEKTQSWRLRIVIDRNGNCTVDANPTAPMDSLTLLLPLPSTPTPTWRVVVDSQTIVPSAFTTHKTTAREDYAAARTRVGIQSPAEQTEVLVVNPDGHVMEGSITTPYFRRRSNHPYEESATKWVTPPLSSGGNAGTTRRYALDSGFCAEQVILATQLVDGEVCWLSNGVRGFIPGVVIRN